MSTQILLVDDHDLFRQGLVSLIEQQPDLEIVGQASEGRSAVQLATQFRPDVVLMDLSLPEMNGVDAIRQILAATCQTVILALSSHCELDAVERALAAGANGYLVKNCNFDEVIEAVSAVAAGGTYLCSAVSRCVVDGCPSEPRRKRIDLAHLTPREREVLQLIAEGHPPRDVAERLGVSVNTICTHRENLMRKLDSHSIAKLTKYAIREGLTSVD